MKPMAVFRDIKGRRVLGYYGAIAEWLDVELLAETARHFPDCLLLLVGADECGARQHLTGLPNVMFIGEVKYTELPYYLYGMDVCLLPFHVISLTLATNPVKVYEYLSAGKPVVAVKLPELAQFDGLVATAERYEEFISCIKDVLAAADDKVPNVARRAFASANTWDHRVEALFRVVATLPEPRASVIVVTYNNLELTRICLKSLEQLTECNWVETIVVDNASSDGTSEFLQQWEASAPNRKTILNSNNLGFAAANNQGLALSQADYLVMLNNDTEVTSGWLQTLINHLASDKTIGMIGPVTNNIGNEARIKTRYQNSREMRHEARKYTLLHLGETFSIRTLAFFASCCLVPCMKRWVH
ncbi:glycosyltransferase [Polaromonas sp. P1-6]|nr:glycosyltransferase [Polaromonas sp. P1-6]